MTINELSLRFFRNYTQQTISFSEGINILVGKNGQGKTNLIEAIVYLSSGRSFRVNEEVYLVQEGQAFASIHGTFHVNKKVKEIDAVIRKEGKYLRINQQVCKRVSEFVGQVNVVLFSPDDMNYFDGSPSIRRRSLDLDLGKMDSRYLELLSTYYALLKQRNTLLKQIKVDEALLDVLTEQMIDVSFFIIETRLRYIKQINQVIGEKYVLLSQTDQMIKVEYESPLGVLHATEGLKEALRAKMKASIKQDIKMKATTVGLHRDDVKFYMNDYEIVKFASQGQKRLTLLAFKLSLLDIIKETTGEFPILCLDDIFSELDQEKIDRCLAYIDPAIQVIITATDSHDITFIHNTTHYYVEQGQIEIKEK